MSATYPRSPKLLKGALIEISGQFIGPAPNVIVFQYNPEKMTRSMSLWKKSAASDEGVTQEDQTAQPSDPSETFSLVLEFDAADDLEKSDSHPVAKISGVAARIAALETLLYPQTGSFAGGLLGAEGSALGGAISGALSKAGISFDSASRSTVPILLFAWGPGRILPVRMTKFSVEEEAYSPTLFPIRAKVSVDLEVILPTSFGASKDGSRVDIGKEIAIAAYIFNRKQTKMLATTNTANNIESILAMLPF